MELPPPLYSETPVRYIIDLDGDGRFLELSDTADPKDPRRRRGIPRLMPQVVRTSGIRPLLITDKADYVLGFTKEGAKPERAAAAHQAYRALLDRCVAATALPELRAIQTFLDGDRSALVLPDDFDPGALMTFRVDFKYPTSDPAVQAFWAAEHTPQDDKAPVMQCVVCGQQRPVLRSLQGTIKGIPGGQSSGTAIISANADAFESYGLKNSLVAPTCARCGERFTKALNALLAGEDSHLFLAGSAFVFWTRVDHQVPFGRMLSKPEAQDVQALLDSLRSGKERPGIDDSAFYAVSLSASGARVVVRDWIDTTIREASESLARWFRLQRIVDHTGSLAAPLGMYGLAGATVRDLKDLPTTTPRALLRTALAQTPLPLGLLAQAVRRNRAEQKVTRQRATLIKLVLLSHAPRSEEETMINLELHHDSAAYQCGRLLAVLEEIQRQAIPGLNAGIVERFYGTASANPIAVFPRLVRGAVPHLAKLRRDKRGAYIALQERLEGVLATLPDYPTTLSLRDQGLFSLGYYHQRAHDRAQMLERKAQRATAQQSDAAEQFADDENA